MKIRLISEILIFTGHLVDIPNACAYSLLWTMSSLIDISWEETPLHFYNPWCHRQPCCQWSFLPLGIILISVIPTAIGICTDVSDAGFCLMLMIDPHTIVRLFVNCTTFSVKLLWCSWYLLTIDTLVYPKSLMSQAMSILMIFIDTLDQNVTSIILSDMYIDVNHLLYHFNHIDNHTQFCFWKDMRCLYIYYGQKWQLWNPCSVSIVFSS